LGLKDFTIRLNSLGCERCRPPFRSALRVYLKGKKGELCQNCKRRIDSNPLRALDCKVDGPNLSDAPRSLDFLCAECRSHQEKLEVFLREAGGALTIDPRLVRGLDYYTRTVFEMNSGLLGSQDALLAGGRYDNLVESLGGPSVPAVGFALGVDRTLLALKAGGSENLQVHNHPSPKVFVVVLGEPAAQRGFQLLQELRRHDVLCEGLLPHKSLKAQMRRASQSGSSFAILLGDLELEKGRATIKDLGRGVQEEVELSRVASYIQSQGRRN